MEHAPKDCPARAEAEDPVSPHDAVLSDSAPPPEVRKSTERDVAVISSIDVCIVCDCTGSMGRWLDASRDAAIVTAEKIRERYKGCHYRLGFVGYRDYADEQRFEVAGFTHDVASVRERIMKVVAKGGGDAAEDVAGALDVVLRKMTWEGDVRILIFVADAPGHGRTLHPASVSDEYPDGDKFGLDPLSLVRELAVQGVDMTVLKVSPDLNMVCNGEEGKGGSEAGTPAPPLVQMIDLFDAAHKEGAAMRHGSPVAGPSGAGSGAQFVVLDVVAQGAGAAAAVPATVGGRGSHKGAGFRGLASMAPPPAGTPASAGVPPAAAPGLAPHRAGRAAMAATVAAIASPARTDAYSSGYVCPTMDDPALSSAASVVLSSAVIDSVTRSMARRAGGGGGGGAAAAGTGGAAVPAP